MNVGRFRDPRVCCSLVWQDVVDGSEGEHDQAEGCVGGVKSVGAVDDEPDAAVEAFVSGVGDAQAYGGEDARSSLSDGAGQGDEGREAAAGCLGAEPIEQDTDVGFVQVTGEHCAQRFLEGVGAPQVASAAFDFAEGGSLIIGQVSRIFHQRPAGSAEPACDVLVGQFAQFLPYLAADLVQRGGGEGDDVERVVTDDRLAGVGAHAFPERGRHVHRHRLYRLGAVRAKVVEEMVQGGRVLAHGDTGQVQQAV